MKTIFDIIEKDAALKELYQELRKLARAGAKHEDLVNTCVTKELAQDSCEVQILANCAFAEGKVFEEIKDLQGASDLMDQSIEVAQLPKCQRSLGISRIKRNCKALTKSDIAGIVAALLTAWRIEEPDKKISGKTARFGSKEFQSRPDGIYKVWVDSKGNRVEEPVSNFSIEILEEHLYDSEAGNERHLCGEIKCDSSLIPFTWSYDQFSNNEEFKKLIHATAGSRAVFDETCLGDLRSAVKLMSEPPVIQKTAKLGWHKGAFYSPDIVITKDSILPNIGRLIELPEFAFAAKVHISMPPDQVTAAKNFSDYIDTMLSLGPVNLVYPTVSASLLASIHRLFGNAPKPWVWLFGRTGEGKSFVADYAQLPYGADLASENTLRLSWTSSSKELAKQLSYFRDCLSLVDDYKLANLISMKPSEVGSLIQNHFDNTGRGTLKQNRDFNPTATTAGIILTTAEDVPSCDAAVRARLSAFPVPVFAKNIEAGRKIKDRAENYRGILPHFIQYVLREHADGLGQRLNEECDTLLKPISGRQNDYRIALMAAQLLLGMDLAFQYIEHTKGMDSGRIADLKGQWRAAIEQHVQETADAVISEQASNRFVTAIKSAIFSGNAYIHTIDVDLHSMPTRAVRVGFTKEGLGHQGVVYLDPEACVTLVNRIMRESGTSLSFSTETIGRQLKQDGALARTNNIGCQYRARFGAQNLQTWAVKREVFDFAQPDLKPVASNNTQSDAIDFDESIES